MAGRDPALWWLNFELPDHFDRVISVVRVDDYFLLTTNRAVWKFSEGRDGLGSVTLVRELT